MRGRLNVTVLGATGAPLAGASIQVNIRGGSAATLWNQEVGGTNPSNPLTTDAQGRVLAWVDRGAYDLVISGSGISTYTVNVEVVPGRDASIDSNWIGAGVLLATHYAAGSVTSAALAAGVGVPIGVSLDFNGPEVNIPTGYLPSDGRAISRTTFATAFGVMGTIHGAGDGSTTFNIPDDRGRVRVGKDDMGGTPAGRLAGSALSGGATTLGATAGEAAHANTIAELPAHGHTPTDPGHAHNMPAPAVTTAGGTGVLNTSGSSQATAAATSSATTGLTIGTTGSGSAHNNVQPSRIVNTIIRVS